MELTDRELTVLRLLASQLSRRRSRPSYTSPTTRSAATSEPSTANSTSTTALRRLSAHARSTSSDPCPSPSHVRRPRRHPPPDGEITRYITEGERFELSIRQATDTGRPVRKSLHMCIQLLCRVARASGGQHDWSESGSKAAQWDGPTATCAASEATAARGRLTFPEPASMPAELLGV